MRKLTVALLGLTVLTNCSKIDVDSSIPDYRVDFKTTLPSDYNYLKTVGTYKVYTEDNGAYAANTYLGYGGLLVFRDFNGTIRCCDLACPFCYSEEHCNYRIVPNSSLLAKCNNCNSVYDIQWGLCIPVEGPSKEPLKIYSHCSDTGTAIRVTY